MKGITIPPRIAELPKNAAGYPVPWFVAWIDGKPDFRVIGEGKIVEAIRFNKCWICGQPLVARGAFVAGPMCGINRTSSEPPSHKSCAVFAAKVCPFMANPEMGRRENNLPEDKKDPAGIHLDRNPGVAMVWVARFYQVMKVPNGVLLTMGDPDEVLWFARGREATREEVEASIDSGLPALREIAAEEGPEAVAQLEDMARTFKWAWLPKKQRGAKNAAAIA